MVAASAGLLSSSALTCSFKTVSVLVTVWLVSPEVDWQAENIKGHKNAPSKILFMK
ncbi:hypothetical protein D3C85_1490040 [compost metagenome]